MSTNYAKYHARGTSITLFLFCLFCLNTQVGLAFDNFKIEFLENVEKVDTIGGPTIDSIGYSDPSDCGLMDGEITIISSGGTPPLLYSIDGGANFFPTNVFQNLPGGVYAPSVANSDTSCFLIGPNAVLVDPVSPVINNVVSMAPSDCNTSDAWIQISASGNGDLEYSINAGIDWQLDSMFTDLPENRYLIFVRNTNGTCEVAYTSNPLDLVGPDAPSIDNVSSVGPSDCETDDGTIDITATAGTGTTEFSINGGNTWETSGSYSGLGSGTYPIMIRNDGGSCEVAYDINPIILAAPLANAIAQVEQTNISDCNVQDGTITITTVEPGTPSLYSLNNGMNYYATNSFSNLGAGIYTIMIANMDTTCAAIYSQIIELTSPVEPTVLSVDVAASSDCGMSDASITINTSGSADLEYSITNGNGWQNSALFSNVPSGSYPVLVRNTDGTCQVAYDMNPVVVTDPVAPQIDSVKSSNVTVCGLDDGAIIVYATDSGLQLEYSIDDGMNWQANDTFNNLTPGLYDVVIRNNDQTCEVSYVLNSVVISNPNAPSIASVDATNPTGCINDDGEITINASGGIAPLIYSIDGGTTWATSNVFSSLSSAIYTIDVANADTTCIVSETDVELMNDGVGTPDVELMDYSLCIDASGAYALSDGNIIIDGGSSPPVYTIEYSSADGSFTDPTDGNTDFTLNTNAAGTYFITVDVTNTTSGCVGSDVLTFNVLDQPMISLSPSTICQDETVTLTSPASDEITWTVLSGDMSSLACTDCPNNTALPFETSEYELIAANTDGVARCADTATVMITVEEFAPLSTLGKEQYYQLNADTCGGSVNICLNATFADLSNMVIRNNGTIWTDTITACSFDTVSQYDYSDLLDAGFSGPYLLNFWTVNGTTFIGQFGDANGLVDSMNVYDPAGNWTLDATNTTITGGQLGGTYSDLSVQSIPDAETRVIRVADGYVPGQMELTLGMGSNIITIEDLVSGCVDSANIEVIGVLNIYDGALTFDVGLNCDSIIETCIGIAPSDLANYTVTDNGQPFNNYVAGCTTDSLYAYDYSLIPDNGANGPYLLQSWSVDGTVYIGSFSNLNVLVDSMNVWDPASNWTINMTAQTIEGGDFSSSYGGIDVLQVISTISSMSPVSTFGFDADMGMALDTGFHQIIVLENNSGCQDILNFEVTCLVPCPDFFAVESESVEIADCDSTHAFGVAIDTAMLSNFIIEDNGMLFTGTISGNTELLLEVGMHTLIIQDQTTFCRDTAIVNVTCAAPCDDLFTNAEIISLDNCMDITTICTPISVAESMNYTVTNNGAVFNDFSGCEFDTLQAYVFATLPGGGNVGPYNLDSWTVSGATFISPFNVIGDLVDSMNVWDPTGNWTVSGLTIQGGSTANTYGDLVISQGGTPTTMSPSETVLANALAIELGTGTHELIFTDTTTGCSDVLDAIIECPDDCSTLISVEEVVMNTEDCQGPIEVCIDVAAAALADYTMTDNGILYTVPFDDCVANSSVIVYLGFGTHELIFTNASAGCSDTLNVTLGCVDPDAVSETVIVGETGNLCVDTSELPGSVVSFTDACGSNNQGFADFVLNQTTNCVEYTGVTPGTDNACLVICDASGLCDTTYLTVTVTDVPVLDPPVANMDTDTILENQTVLLNVMGNDDFEGTIDTLYIVEQSDNGTVIVTAANEIIYTPTPEYCNMVSPDEFRYAICNEGGCDTTTVNVYIACDELEVKNAFSPNNDGINDSFVIEGVEGFPNNELLIFNRWGNMIYKMSGYDNSWIGTFDGKDIPDGTYFYLFDEGNGNIRSGYIQIQR